MPESAGQVRARAAIIRREADSYGLRITSHDGIVTVSGSFTPGDSSAYITMESNARAILAKFRWTSSGSIWGTDSGSVGGAVGLKNGYVTMNKSGCEKRLSREFE
jgi:hypothetical protein